MVSQKKCLGKKVPNFVWGERAFLEEGMHEVRHRGVENMELHLSEVPGE